MVFGEAGFRCGYGLEEVGEGLGRGLVVLSRWVGRWDLSLCLGCEGGFDLVIDCLG